jgi:hypothetical protein
MVFSKGGVSRKVEHINFVTKYSNCFYKIELSKTLLHFIEFDFSYFWEQSLALGKQAKKTNSYSYEQSYVLRNLISKCHPYFEALVNFDFDYIVVDCIIEHICRTEGIGLEVLWSRCIAPKNSYEKVIFQRISEYKTNRAINQWVNLLRIQEYARKKTEFIFDENPCSIPEAKARCKYFDLAYSVAAKEIGYPSDELPSVQRFSLTQMPNAVFIISKTSKNIYKRIMNKFDTAPEPPKYRINDNLRDLYSLDAFDYIKDITRPPDPEMLSAIENFRYLPDVVYLPNSFKAIIDLEFEKMLENGIMLQKCEKCGRFFNSDINYRGKLCDRVKSTGKSCREEEMFKTDDAEVISEDIMKKSEMLYTNLSQKVGKEIPKSEFDEWSEYLIKLKKNVESQNSSIEDLESFLQYSEKMYGEIK